MDADSFRCLLVKKLGKDRLETGIEQRPLHELPDGDVTIEVEYSSLNYKDALAVEGHPGVVRRFPHVPGIDAAGTIRESRDSRFHPGQPVLVTGYEFGSGWWGGLSEVARVPADWIVPIPEGLSKSAAMAYGTAGFTAAQSVLALERHGIKAGEGEVVVTGATGGVGTLAVMLLANLGHQVVAVTGKPERTEWLKGLGAARVVSRDEIIDTSNRPLLSTRWAGAIDTAGGVLLTSLLRATAVGGCVTACGLVAGTELPMTVYPFILRGITLAGIDSAWCSREERTEIWRKLAGPWKLPQLDRITETIPLEAVTGTLQQLRDGTHVGRTVVQVQAAA